MGFFAWWYLKEILVLESKLISPKKNKSEFWCADIKIAIKGDYGISIRDGYANASAVITNKIYIIFESILTT